MLTCFLWRPHQYLHHLFPSSHHFSPHLRKTRPRAAPTLHTRPMRACPGSPGVVSTSRHFFPFPHHFPPHHEKTRRAQHQTPITQQHNVVSWRYIYLFIVYALTHFRNECCKAFMSHHRCRKTFSSVQPHAAPSSASDANCWYKQKSK
jgi:hypothetical protein